MIVSLSVFLSRYFSFLFAITLDWDHTDPVKHFIKGIALNSVQFLCEEALCNSGEEKLLFKKEKPQAELSTVTGWGRGEREQRSESQSLTND